MVVGQDVEPCGRLLAHLHALQEFLDPNMAEEQGRPKMTMYYRKPDWWWDVTWTPVSGCRKVSDGCRYCWSLPWLKSHTWTVETVYFGAIEKMADESLRWTGNSTALRVGDPRWDFPITDFRDGVVNPALGPGKPSLIFAVVDGDLFLEGRPLEDINRVCRTLVASKHLGLLCTKYTRQMVDYFALLDPRSVRRWQSKLLLGFSAENQACFDERWSDLRPLADAGWFVYVALSPLLELVTLPPDALELLRWVVVYGECNRWEPELCRPMDADWALAILKQCRAAGIPFFFRGMHTGAYIPPYLTKLRQFPSWP
jgi:protein gp37